MEQAEVTMTKMQYKVAEAIFFLSAEKPYPPTVQEIATRVGKAPSTVQIHIDSLCDKGFLYRDQGKIRTLSLTASGYETVVEG